MSAPGAEALATVLSPLRKSQRKIVDLAVRAIAHLSQASSFSVAAFLVRATGVRADSALNRFYRLLHNPRLDDWAVSARMLALFAQVHTPLRIALDWTEWRPPLRMLLASVCTGTRAVPVLAAAFSKTDLPRSQNCRENNFLRVLAMLLSEVGATACFLADRGFRRVSFLQLLLKRKGHFFVVRLMDQVTVESKQGRRLLSQCGLTPGHALDLGWVRLRQDAAVTVRVVGIWKKGQGEPWWLATNLDDPLARIAALYDRRMAVEEQIRDTKGARFGLALVWTQIRTPQALARFALLIGLARLLLTALGHALAQRRPDLRLPCKRKGPRLSLVSVGRLYWNLLDHPTPLDFAFLVQNIPPPTMRAFPWLDTATEPPAN